MNYVFIVLLNIVWLTNSFSNFCSVICGTNCNGDLTTNCNNNCQSDGAWTPSGNTCIIKASTNWVKHDSTSNLGGGLNVFGASFNNLCFDFQVYGYVNVVQNIRVSTPGITVPYFAMKIYLGILALDTLCWGCPPGPFTYFWTSTTTFSILFNDPQATQTTNPTIYPLSNPSKSSSKCTNNNTVKSSYFRISKSYNYHLTNALLRWTISCNELINQKQWGLREFLIIYQPCDIACTLCFAASPTKCTACAITYYLSNTTCSSTCLTGYGYTATNVCILCDKKCSVCYMAADNCSSCTTSGTNIAYLSTTANPNYPTCVNPCSPPYFGNKSTHTCDLCNTGCSACLNSATYCTNCSVGYFWTGWMCYSTCPSGYFEENGTNCTRCFPFCSVCIGVYNICTSCVSSGTFTAYLYNTSSINGSCVRLCPNAFYTISNPNLCLACNSSCTTCTGNPSPCTKCALGYYLSNLTCSNTCPNGLIPYNSTSGGQCVDCNLACVELTMNMYFSNVVNEQIYVDMAFTQNLDYSTFDFPSFQTITITSQNIQYTADMFTYTYLNLTASSYRIIIAPKTYIFLYNATFTVTTKAEPSVPDKSLQSMPFKSTVYLKSAALTWFLIKGPPFTDLEMGIMTSFSTLSTKTNNVLTLPYVQQFKKSGIFSLLFSGAQVTSLSLLSNQIQSQNLYEGVRIWAIFVFFDAPPYERISDKTKRLFSPTIEDQIRNAQQQSNVQTSAKIEVQSDASIRQLFSTDTMFWRFQRTGQTSFFIYDVYVPMILITLCWIGLAIAHFCKNAKWYVAYAPHLYSAVHKVHEVSIMYVTMASIVEFIYFEASSTQRIVSAIVCVTFNLYFLAYELYIYYDMIKYPLAEIGSSLYEYYVLHYGFFLKTIRFAEYDINESWSPKHWFRPYNYHILSFYKKCMMVIALPLFYNTQYAQMGALIFIQTLETIRFCVTWPFLSSKRNLFRVSLQVSLLLFFVINLVQISLLQAIMSADTNTLESTAVIFYRLGWVGFAFCFYFNIAFVCTTIYDLCIGLRESNRTKMEKARKMYYFQKIRSYEKNNEASSKDLVDQWMKLGNLKNQAYGDLPEINVRIEMYEFRKIATKFHLLIKKITKLAMKKHLKLRKPNNTTIGSKIEKSMTISQLDHPKLYNIINEVYQKYQGPHVQTIRIKTFLNVWQKDYQQGEPIVFDRNMMFQKVELLSYQNEHTQLQLKTLFNGFPIDPSIIENYV